jgi:hypothetical protein
MKNKVRSPFRFFLITFIWLWVLWTPLLMGSLKIIPDAANLLSILTLPVIMLGVFGPLAGALSDGGAMSFLILKQNPDYGWQTLF